MEYLIDGVLPKNKVSLLAGPSGSGKTTLLFNIIRDWSIGAPVFGQASHPVPYLYIALDRDADEIEDRIMAAGLDPAMVPHLSLIDPDLTFQDMWKEIPSDVRLIFLDGFARICPGGKLNDYEVVSRFCLRLLKVCKQKDLTILAVCHTTKVKAGEQFLHPRHRILGSVAWGGFTSTLIFIDEANPEVPGDTTRRVEVLPRTGAAPSEHIYRMIEGGSLVPADVEILAESTGEREEAIKLYMALPFDEDITTSFIQEIAESIGVSRASLYRLLEKWVNDQTLLKTGRGLYYKDSSLHQNGGTEGLD